VAAPQQGKDPGKEAFALVVALRQGCLFLPCLDFI